MRRDIPTAAYTRLTARGGSVIGCGRAIARNDAIGKHVEDALGGEVKYPPQYERCHPKSWPPAMAWKE